MKENELKYYVYIMTNKNNTVLYTGMSAHLKQRIYQHKNKYSKGFANKYNINKLVYYESFDTPNEAIKREKQLKKWNRAWKISLVNELNPDWMDLSYFFD